jgi:glycosyltransferase involved in cell wall biosynthesis
VSGRLAYVAGTYPQLSETFVTGELRELLRAGEDPLVFAILRGSGELEGAPAASYLVELPKTRQLGALFGLLARGPLRTVSALLRPSLRAGGSMRDMVAVAPFARDLRGVRHIHAHFASLPTDVAARLSALTGIPFSFTAHARDIYVEWERMDEKLADAAFGATVCEYNARYIEERVAGARLEQVICGVDVEDFRRSVPYDPDGPIVAVGRLVAQKGFLDLVRAAALVQDSIPEVVIAGEGQQRGELEALIGELGAPVRLVGALPHAEVRALVESASCSVLPCVVAADGARDSMPVSLKEAMALELPVVGTDEVGLPELIGPDRGLLVPPGDPSALGEALKELAAADPAERERMGRAGREFVAEHCNLRTETAKLLALFSPGS